MIKVHLRGRMGNQMFQYAFAKIVAKAYHTTFWLDTNDTPFDLAWFELDLPFRFFHQTWLFKAYNYIQKFLKPSHFLDLSDCTQQFPATLFTDHTYYRGYFQYASLMEEHRLLLLDLFKPKQKYRTRYQEKYGAIFSAQKTIVISLRLGDYKQYALTELGSASMLIGIAWYQTVVNRLPIEGYKVYVVSDEIEEAQKTTKDFLKKAEYVSESPIIQFQLLMNADIAVLSNSTFAWWAGFLNNKPKRRVIAPKHFLGHNVHQEFPKGIETHLFEWQ